MDHLQTLIRTEQDRVSARETLRRSLRPVRIMLSLAFLAIVLTTPGEQAVSLGQGMTFLLAAVASANVVVNTAAVFGRVPVVAPRGAFATQLATDGILALVGMLLLDAAATPLAWIALLLPVFDAGAVFGATAAGLAWGALSLAYVVVRLQVSPADESGANVLVLALQQLTAVAVVALPASFVASRLRDDLAHSHGARAAADARSAEVLAVAAAAERLATAEDPDAVLDLAVDCASSLGFPSVDLCERRDGRTWRLLRAVGSGRGPEPRLDPRIAAALDERGPVTSGIGETVAEDDLRLLGFRAGVVIPVSRNHGHAVVLRAWSTEPLDGGSSTVEALALLGQLTGAAWESTTTLNRLESWAATLAHRATHDELTGLANRAHLFSTLADSLDRMRSSGTQFAVLFLDLDGFKEVNDGLGHDAGDAVLQGIAERLRRQVRDHDLLARLGGDEFVVVLNDLGSAEQAVTIASRLCAAVAAPFAIGETKVTLGVSIGIAHASPDDTADSLLTSADRVMYEAKRDGGSRFVVSRVEAA
jgi:diguanylate cyclase (GGDEF)-like protein